MAKGGKQMNIGEKIIEIRKERKMTQEDLAKIFHVTRQTVSNWEHEKSYPDLQTIIQISDEFNISLDKLLKEDIQMVKRMLLLLTLETSWSIQFLPVLRMA